jgi:hypothetical protein
MYIDGFYFSPFEIKQNVLSMWLGLFVIKDAKIFWKDKQITCDEFYDLFVERAKDT